MTQPESIVFFGSGPVATKSLAHLARTFPVEAIITKPATLQELKDHYALVPVYAVSTKAELDDLLSQTQFTSSLGIVIDFGIIISQRAIDSFPKGIVNSHFSLLPEWRGADPLTFTILSGQQKTGISVMLLTAGMDEGPLLAQAPYEIPHGYTTPQLTEDLIELSAATLKEILPEYLAGTLAPQPQAAVSIAEDIEPTYSRKLTKQDGLIDWHKSATVLEREIRAFIAWPKSYTTFAKREVIITAASVAHRSGAPGGIIIDGKQLFICCGEDALAIERLKPANKKEMTAAAFLAGYKNTLMQPEA